MSAFSNFQRPLVGAMLVFLQFLLLLALAFLAAPALMRGAAGLGSGVLVLLSLLLFVWTLAHNRLGNFNIRPAPKEGGTLVTSGPYRWIRHPMYTSVMLAAAALATVATTVVAWAAWAALAVVLGVKALLEERWVAQQHPAYAAYCLRCKRFIPWIF